VIGLSDKPIIYCISEGLADESNFSHSKREILRRISNAAACGVSFFQIREKKLSAAGLFELSAEAADAALEAGVKLLVNGRFDIALAAGADGVHLQADGLPADEIRRVVPGDFIIGVSTHTLDEAVAARDAGADFAVFGPVFSSPGKGEGVGLDVLTAVCEELDPFPVIALGGIDERRIAYVLAGGSSGFASIRYLNKCLAAGRHVPV
jgi:thiamine-phosphate pyrophosphorylase